MSLLVFAISLVILAVEVFYTRLFSVMFWQNTAFIVLSLMMLGVGSAGVLIALAPRIRKETARWQLAWLIPTFALSIPGSYLTILNVNVEAWPIWNSPLNFLAILILTMGPFLVGGVIISIIFSAYRDKVSWLYFCSMCGGALGAYCTLGWLLKANGPNLLLMLASFVALVGIAYAIATRIAYTGLACAAIILAMAIVSTVKDLRTTLLINYAKGAIEEASRYTLWDPVGRVKFLAEKAFQINGDQISPVLHFSGDATRERFLQHNVLELAYHLGPFARCAIIEPGGGSDVLTALISGSKDINAVESNGSMVNLMRIELAPFTGNLYNRPEVHPVISEAREFLARQHDKMDLIQLSFRDNRAVSPSSGSYTLSENYLFTTDAMDDYLDHLTPEGIVSFSRWAGAIARGYFGTYRIVGMAEQALRKRGISDPENHIVVMQGAPPQKIIHGDGYQSGDETSGMATILVSNAAFTKERLSRLDQAVHGDALRPLWMPGQQDSDPVIAKLFEMHGSDDFYQGFYQRVGIDISPVSDNRPFFLDMVRPSDLQAFKELFPWDTNQNYAMRYLTVSIFPSLLGMLSVMMLVFIALPLLLRSDDIALLKQQCWLALYFICLGTGFIGIALGLVQKCTLFLGDPIYSFTFVMAVLLFFSGVGSLRSGRISTGTEHAAGRSTWKLVTILACYGIVLVSLLDFALAMPPVLKEIAAALILMPSGILMGMLFPLGIRSIHGDAARVIPWMWALTAGCSVLTGTVFLYMTMSWGCRVTWYSFTAVYLLAGLAMRRHARIA